MHTSVFGTGRPEVRFSQLPCKVLLIRLVRITFDVRHRHFLKPHVANATYV